MKVYKANASSVGNGVYAIEVPELKAFTQALNRDTVPTMAASLITDLLDVTSEQFDVVIEWNERRKA